MKASLEPAILSRRLTRHLFLHERCKFWQVLIFQRVSFLSMNPEYPSGIVRIQSRESQSGSSKQLLLWEGDFVLSSVLSCLVDVIFKVSSAIRPKIFLPQRDELGHCLKTVFGCSTVVFSNSYQGMAFVWFFFYSRYWHYLTGRKGSCMFIFLHHQVLR